MLLTSESESNLGKKNKNEKMMEEFKSFKIFLYYSNLKKIYFFLFKKNSMKKKTKVTHALVQWLVDDVFSIVCIRDIKIVNPTNLKLENTYKVRFGQQYLNARLKLTGERLI